MSSIFRMVCAPAALASAPLGWTAETLREGELALLVDDGGLEAINAAAHALDLVTVSIVRREETAAEQAETVIAFAGSLPLVWVSGGLTESERTWARERPPMTLLIAVDGPLPDAERARIERFLALLARQTE
ncbi:MAG TPA: hypothetical protein VG388_04835 [Solirubrobacteraceae bacterium]|nr:hypothetical protein [Solirubrobacteraceae bacterium]